MRIPHKYALSKDGCLENVHIDLVFRKSMRHAYCHVGNMHSLHVFVKTNLLIDMNSVPGRHVALDIIYMYHIFQIMSACRHCDVNII